jgi:DNA-binding NtrC family response regulator
LGGVAEISVDVRILAATNRPVTALDRTVLREDLYYRLNVFNIHMSPLRERTDDIPLLAQKMLTDLNRKHQTEITSLHPGTLERLQAHSWPGNVRELRNVLEWAVITVGKGTVHPWHLPKTFGIASEAPQQPGASTPPVQETGRTLDEVEMEYILATLKATNNDRKKAAHMLGISLRTLYNRLSQAAGAEKESSPQTRAAGSEVS